MSTPRITDYSLWDLRDQFSDIEAAYLWLGLEPSYGNDHPSNVISMRFALDEAKRRGELTNQTPSYTDVSYNRWGREKRMFVACITHYSRQALRQYAEHHHQRPLFLFPEDRPDFPAIQSVDEQRIPTVIAAATELGINPLDIRRGEKERIKKKLTDYPGKMTEAQFESTWAFGKKKEMLKN